MKFPANYTQIPNYEIEYKEILENFSNGMNKDLFENMVAEIKKSRFKSKYKYRTHLQNLGIILTIGNKVFLTPIADKIKIKEISLDEGLRILIWQNSDLKFLLEMFIKYNYFNNKDKKYLCNMLYKYVFIETPENTISRYLTPIINLFNISKINLYLNFYEQNYNKEFSEEHSIDTEEYFKTLKSIENFYLENVLNYGDVLAIEKVEKFLRNNYSYSKEKVANLWNKMYYDANRHYSYMFTTIPNWGTKYKKIIIDGQAFTHLILINKMDT